MAAVSAVLASIPSPPTGIYHVGPFTIHMYGLMLLLGIAACIWLTGVRWVRWAASGISATAPRSGAAAAGSSAPASTTARRAGTGTPPTTAPGPGRSAAGPAGP